MSPVSPSERFGCVMAKLSKVVQASSLHRIGSQAGSLRYLFIWKMAWRDNRASRRRLLLFSISITLGIAALVGIGSFRHSLAQAIDDQARSLIGADLVVESTRPFRPEDEALLHSLATADP